MSTYSTSDFQLAASLAYQGFILIDVDRTDPRRAQFCFKREEGLDKALEMFWQRQMQVEPRAYSMQQKMLKAQIYSDQ